MGSSTINTIYTIQQETTWEKYYLILYSRRGRGYYLLLFFQNKDFEEFISKFSSLKFSLPRYARLDRIYRLSFLCCKNVKLGNEISNLILIYVRANLRKSYRCKIHRCNCLCSSMQITLIKVIAVKVIAVKVTAILGEKGPIMQLMCNR